MIYKQFMKSYHVLKIDAARPPTHPRNDNTPPAWEAGVKKALSVKN